MAHFRTRSRVRGHKQKTVEQSLMCSYRLIIVCAVIGNLARSVSIYADQLAVPAEQAGQTDLIEKAQSVAPIAFPNAVEVSELLVFLRPEIGRAHV